MSENMILIGSEDVYRGGSMMQDAARTMTNAAGQIDYALQHHRTLMDEWLGRFEAALQDGSVLAKLEEIRCGIIDVERLLEEERSR